MHAFPTEHGAAPARDGHAQEARTNSQTSCGVNMRNVKGGRERRRGAAQSVKRLLATAKRRI
eukprot:scaffold4348_cov163-Pinguiococcus_pyrenoidosus.AAC.2